MREQVDRLLSRERNKKSAHSRGRERAMGPGQVGSQRKIQNTRMKKYKKISKRKTMQKMNSQHTAEGEKERWGRDK